LELDELAREQCTPKFTIGITTSPPSMPSLLLRSFIRYGSKVHVVHRRGELRASRVMQERVRENPKIELVLHSEVVEAYVTPFFVFSWVCFCLLYRFVSTGT
jgi:hypothetical protein